MVIGDKQSQKAGNNSQLMQAGIINYYNGIDEKRAREICEETFEIVRRDFTADANAYANERVRKLEEALIPKMQQIDGALTAFADPSFQFLLISAQKAAAATERDSDYDMLSQLLIYRITKGQARKNRAGISRAIEVIDKIDDDALCALTVLYAAHHLVPVAGSCKAGLDALADLFEKLMYMELPKGTDWIEHLDILDAVRIHSSQPLIEFDKYCSTMMPGYSCAGIRVGTEAYRNALDQLKSVELASSFLLQSELLEDYVRLPVVEKSGIDDLRIKRQIIIDEKLVEVSTPISEKESLALKAIWDMYSTDVQEKKAAISAFMSMWDSYPPLKQLHTWWNSLSVYFSITRVGSILAYTNARRLDELIPDLPLERC